MRYKLLLSSLIISGSCFAQDIQSFKNDYYKLTNDYVEIQNERNQVIATPEGNTTKEIETRSKKLKKLDFIGWKTNIELYNLIVKALDTFAQSSNKPEELASYSKELLVSDLDYLKEAIENPQNNCQ